MGAEWGHCSRRREYYRLYQGVGLRLSFTVKWHAFDPVPASFSLAISPLAVSGRIASIHHVMSPATGTLYLRLVGIQRVEPEASHCSQIDGKNRTDRCATPKHAVFLVNKLCLRKTWRGKWRVAFSQECRAQMSHHRSLYFIHGRTVDSPHRRALARTYAPLTCRHACFYNSLACHSIREAETFAGHTLTASRTA